MSLQLNNSRFKLCSIPLFKRALTQLSTALLMLTALSPTKSLAAENTGQSREYIVELTVIKQLDRHFAKEESWPNNISLEYPQNLTFLNDPENIHNQAIPTSANKLHPLSQTYQKHGNIISRLNRSRGYKVLFHQSWLQSIGPESTAKQIVIQAGERIDGISPLAGTIQLYKNRYLHLRSNLWFVEFKPNIDTLTKVTEPTPATASALLSNSSDVTVNTDNQPSMLAVTTAHVIEERLWPIPPIAEDIILKVPHSLKEDRSETLQEPFEEKQDTLEETQKIWTTDIKRISQLQQSRRMRSNEIHYIDHPIFGIIIEVRPKD